ncbi:MAG TPA: type I-C CRISPR-associated protein Cas7/Csd2 [Candidatus Angelobacter sp.]|nr:type I-C CRISPR-associated protein Cas7/Csd2 [Candidatus Angelobacter sp.]
MSVLQTKIDFAVVLRVKHANPNGDPLNGNRPRTDYNGYGEITDVCLKRKIRDRLQEVSEQGQQKYKIFVQSDDRKNDDAKSLRDRAEKALGKKFGTSETAKLAQETWFDVRAFGQLFALPPSRKSKSKDGGAEEGDTGVSIPIRGPVTLQSAFSIQPVDVTSTQITKSVSGEGDGTKRGSDTMGMKHRVDSGVYVFFGSMNPQLAERTGFSAEDAEAIKQVLPKMFENDASSARPDGSMEVLKLIWWKHSSKLGQYSSAKVHRTLSVKPSGEIELASLEGLQPEVIDGF